MTYKFLLFSESKRDFVVEILAPPSTSFYDLHTLIQDSCGYTETGNHTFLICNEDWKVSEKIYLNDSCAIGLDEDIYLMKDTLLDDFIEEEGQHIAYIFETFAKKSLLIEFTESIFGETAEKAYINRRKGTPPPQFETEDSSPSQGEAPACPTSIEEPENKDASTDENISEDEIDIEGFEVTEM